MENRTQALGRLGNWFNVELYGLPTTLPWGLEVPSSNPAFPVGLPADTHPNRSKRATQRSLAAGLCN